MRVHFLSAAVKWAGGVDLKVDHIAAILIRSRAVTDEKSSNPAPADVISMLDAPFLVGTGYLLLPFKT
jgi:hypothetical protein